MAEIGSLAVSLSMDANNFNGTVSQVDRNLRAMGGELKAIQSLGSDYGKSLEGLAQKQDVLQRSLNASSIKLEEQRKKYDEMVASGKASQAAIERQASAVNKAQAEYNKFHTELKQVEKALVDAKSGFKQAEQALGEFGEKASNTGSKMKDIGGTLTTSVTAPLLAFGAGALTVATQFDTAQAKIQGQLGITAQEAENLAEVAQGVWKKGFGEDIGQVTTDLATLKQYLGDVGDEDLSTLLESSYTLQELFGAEIQESARTASVMMKTFGIDGQEAMDLITVAFQNGGDFSGELLDTLREYSPQFKALGYDAEAFTSILIQGAETGAFNLDKLGDTAKESFLRIGDGSKASREALADLGLDFEQIEKDINSGGETANSAFAAVASAIALVQDPAEKSKLAIALMGTPIEDMGPEFQNFFANVSTELEGFEGAASKASETLQQSFGERLQNTWRTAQESLLPLGETLLNIADDWLPRISSAVEGVSNWFNNLSPSAQNATLAIGGIAVVAGPAVAGIGMIASGIGAISGVIAPVVGAIGGFGAAAGTAGASAGILGTAIGALSGPVGWAALGIAAVGTAAVVVANQMSESSIQIADWSSKVSESTAQAVGGFLELSDNATLALNQMAWSGATVTQEMATNIISIYNDMGSQVLTAMQEGHAAQLQTMTDHFANSAALTETEEAEIITLMQSKQAEKESVVAEGQARIVEILNTAKDEKRAITEAEQQEINQIQQTMTENAIEYLTENEREQKVILENLKNEASKITAEQAAEVVKNSVKQKEDVVKEAQDQYDQVVAEIIKQRDEMGTISEEQAEKLIKEAKKQRDETVSTAEDMHEKVVSEAQKQAEEHVDEVDWETGEIKSKWEVLKDNVSKTMGNIGSAIEKGWNDAVTWTKEKVADIKQSAEDKFNEMKTAVETKMSEVKTKIETKWNEAKSFLQKINLLQIGRDIVNGLIKGITDKFSGVKTKIEELAGMIPEWAKKVLGIKSPSRVMMSVGRDIANGLIVGMEQRGAAVTTEARELADSITKAFEKGTFVSESAFDKLGANSQIKEVAKLYNELLTLDIQTNGQREHILEQSNAKRLQIEQKYAETFKRMEEMRQAEYAKVNDGNVNSWQYANIDNSIATRFQEELNNYNLAMQEISLQEKAYIDELNQTLSGKFDKQKEFAEKAKQLNLLSLADEKNLYDGFAALYAKDSEQFQYFNDKSVAIVEQANAKIAQLTSEYENAVNAKAQSLYSFASIFDEITYNADITGEQLLNNLASQVVAMEDWASAMQELASRGINDGLLAELEALGPKAASELMALNSLTDEQLTAYNDLWLEKSQLARSLAEEELAGMRADTEAQIAELNKITSSELDQYTDTWSENAQLVTETVSDGLSGLSSVGASAVDDLIGGLSSKQGELAAVAQSLANTVTGAMNGALDINSPSGEGIAIGEFFGQGVEIGIKESSRNVASASRGLAQDIKDAVRSNMWTKKEQQELGAEASGALESGSSSSSSSGSSTDPYKAQFDAEKKEIDRLKKYKQLSLADELKIYEEYLKGYAKGSEQRIYYEDKVAETKDAINEKLLALNKDYISKIQDANKNFAETEIELAQELEDRKKEINERALQEELAINEEYGEKIKAYKEEKLKEEEELWEEYAEAVKAREQGIYNSFGLFDQVKVSKIAGSRLIKNLETQTKALEGWKNDLANLEGRGIDKGLLEELQALGPDAAGEIKGLVKLSDKELSQYASLWKEKNELARVQADKEMQGMKADTARRVEELRSATAERLSVYQSDWNNALVKVRTGAATELQTLTDEHNKNMETLRIDTAAQLALYEQEWASSISEIRNGTKGQLNAMVEEMPTIGANIIAGMQQGLSDMTPGLISQAQAIADAIKSTIQSALDIHSPSRVMRGFGVNIGQGLMLGMDDMVSKVAQTSQKLSDAASNALGSLANSSARSQAFGTSSASSTSVDNSKTFAPSVVIHTTDSGAQEMERTLRKLQFGF